MAEIEALNRTPTRYPAGESWRGFFVCGALDRVVPTSAADVRFMRGVSTVFAGAVEISEIVKHRLEQPLAVRCAIWFYFLRHIHWSLSLLRDRGELAEVNPAARWQLCGA